MKKYENLKIGDFIKCVFVDNHHNGYNTIDKLYKIENALIQSYNKKGTYEIMSLTIIDDKGYHIFVDLYERTYTSIYHISYGEFFRNFFKIITGKYYQTKLHKESIWFVPATELEVEALKYNL